MPSKVDKPVKSFRAYLDDVTSSSRDVNVIYHFETADRVAEVIVRLLLNEAKPYIELGKGRAILHHKAHILNTQDHLHFRVKGTNIAAINKDGSAHDKSHGIKLQKWATDGARKHYPDFNIPTDGLIESIFSDNSSLLIEAQDCDHVLLSQGIQQAAERLVENQ